MRKKIYLAVIYANLENNVIYIASLQFRLSLDGSMPIWKQDSHSFFNLSHQQQARRKRKLMGTSSDLKDPQVYV
jgi:hypothetical protein